MAVMPAPGAPSNGRRRPVRIDISRSELVGTLLDLETLATEAIVANGRAVRAVLELLPSAHRSEAQRDLIRSHERLVKLLNTARLEAGRYDGVRPA